MRGEQGQSTRFIQMDIMIGYRCSLGISKNIQIKKYIKTSLAGGCFLFCLLLLSLILGHHSALCYFNIGELYSWNLIRVHPSGHIAYIIYQSRLLFLRYTNMLFHHFLKWDDGSVSLAVSYASDYRIRFLGDIWIPFALRTTIGYSVLISST